MFNKKKNILLYVLIFIMVFDINIDKIDALGSNLSVSPSGSGGTQACGGANCLSAGTGGARIALFKKNGTKVGKTIDVWYYDDNVKFFDNGANQNICFKDRQLKQNIKEENLAYCNINLQMKLNNPKNNSGSNDDYNYYGYYAGNLLPGILHGLNSNYTSGNPYGTWNGQYEEKNTRIPNVTNTIMKRIKENIDGATDGYSGKKIAQYTYINNILKAIDPSLSVDTISEELYLQVEPLVQWGNGFVWGGNYSFFGTPSEMHLIFKKTYETGSHYVYYKFPSKILASGRNDVAFNGITAGSNAYDYYKIMNSGVVVAKKVYNSLTEKYEETNSFVPSGWNIINKFNKNSAPTYGTIDNSEIKDTYGVGFISLYDLNKPRCPEYTEKLWKSNSGNSGDKFKSNIKSYLTKNNSWKNDYSWMTHFQDYNFSFEDVKNYIKNNNRCDLPCEKAITKFNGTKLTSAMLDKIKESNNNSDNYINWLINKNDYRLNYELYYGLNSRTGDKYLDDEGAHYRIDNLKNSNLCLVNTCGNVLKTNTNNLTNMYKIFNHSNLDPALQSILREFYPEKTFPSCGDDIPECPVDAVVAKCDINNGNRLVFKDTTKLNCLSGGIAYNAVNTGIGAKLDIKNTQSSYINGKNGAYCREEVEVILPEKMEKQIKAGTVFRWGSEKYKGRDDKFGDMIIRRTCWNTKSSSYDLNWVKTINPDITVHYKEAIPESIPEAKKRAMVVNEKLNWEAQYVFAETDDPYDNNYLDYSEIVNNNYKIKCEDSNCDGKEVRIDFNLIYGDNLKWYANKDKNSNEEYLNYYGEHNKNIIDNGNYALIGYGLPTSFLTPTGLKGNYTWYDSVSTDNDDEGYLTVTLKNLGTSNGDGTYHFDKMLNFAIKDDNTNVADFKPRNYVTYSCGYSIYNELFGYEDGEECVDCPTPKGIDVVFRTVELINENADIEEQIDRAFPGKAGRGRERGSNWTVNKSTGDNYTNDDIASILSSDVYNNEPMYSISLDSALIQEIRNSNRDIRNTTAPDGTNLDPYTYMGTDEEYGYTKGLREVPDKDTDESSLKYFYISNWLTWLSENHNDKFTINNDLENNRNHYSINYAKYNQKKDS